MSEKWILSSSGSARRVDECRQFQVRYQTNSSDRKVGYLAAVLRGGSGDAFLDPDSRISDYFTSRERLVLCLADVIKQLNDEIGEDLVIAKPESFFMKESTDE